VTEVNGGNRRLCRQVAAAVAVSVAVSVALAAAVVTGGYGGDNVRRQQL
jgi:hypothetical protein